MSTIKGVDFTNEERQWTFRSFHVADVGCFKFETAVSLPLTMYAFKEILLMKSV